METALSQFRLASVGGANNLIAYFTTLPLILQSGFGWDVTPCWDPLANRYDGRPTCPKVIGQDGGVALLHGDEWHEDGVPKWQLLELRLVAPEGVSFLQFYEVPAERKKAATAEVSRRDLVRKRAPLLVAMAGAVQAGHLMAGAGIDEVVRFATSFGGLAEPVAPEQGTPYPEPVTGSFAFFDGSV